MKSKHLENYVLLQKRSTKVVRFGGGYLMTIIMIFKILPQVQEQYASEEENAIERTAKTPAVVERAQALISDDLGQSLRVLIDVKPWMETVASGRPYVFQQDGALAHTKIVRFVWILVTRPNFEILLKPYT
ncbi:hypothetical protein G5I_08626 [Acromyrmex echinatior]|uniref:Uncharacterized protein n=1 Tax=Acromyrmex echinatior TaxID=103372 RepID=F4WS17_ACREC|nr:hypothetical protein G5I_08626 [Acromyrmex echinatior]